MKLFGKGRNKGEDHVVENVELEEIITGDEIVTNPEEVEPEEAESEEVELEEAEPEEAESEEVELEEVELEEVEPEEVELEEVEPEETEPEEVEIPEDAASANKTDQEKSLEELDEEVEEEVRRTALLPVDEVNTALGMDQDAALEIIEEPTDVAGEPSKKSEKKKRIRKIILGTLGGILGTILLLYAAGTAYFHYNFFYNTTMNGVDISFKSVQAVHDTYKEDIAVYSLTMITSDEEEEVISGTDINMAYKESSDVATALDLQVAYKWPMMFFKDRQFKIDVDITFNEELLVETVNAMDFANPEETIKPMNAYPTYENGHIIIVDEVYGNNLAENIGEILIEAVYNRQEEIVLMEAKAYIAPEFTSECEEVTEAISTMNTFLKAGINYSEGDVIDAETIGSWITVNKETLEVGLDSDQISTFVKSLESKYNSYSNTISFTNPAGKQATVTGGSYGTRVNSSSEAEQIIKDINSGASVSRDIKYSQKTSASSSSNPFGDTYVCLDLTLQKVYMLYKGTVVLTSDCVTGSVAGGMATPQGVYTLTYKTKNAVLRGDIQADGSYGYASPVSYWMPFNGGIGFHDASWRTTFGGTIYKTNGSHGCVNMPLANAAKLYDYINSSMPIVCHY